jgi:hypothetical protein
MLKACLLQFIVMELREKKTWNRFGPFNCAPYLFIVNYVFLNFKNLQMKLKQYTSVALFEFLRMVHKDAKRILTPLQ